MSTTELNAFLDRLKRSGLLPPARLVQMSRQLLPGCADAEELARTLISKGWLTTPQARDLLAGHTTALAAQRGFRWAWLAAACLLGLAASGVAVCSLPRSGPAQDKPAAGTPNVDSGPVVAAGKLRRPADALPSAPAPIRTPTPPPPPSQQPEKPVLLAFLPVERPASLPPSVAKSTAPTSILPEVQGEDGSAENLLVNGSFEEGPDVDDWGVPLDVGSTAITGWTVTRGQIDFIGNYWTSAEGGRSLDLNGSPGVGGIQQTFKTKKGQRYRVTFALAGNPTEEQGVKRIAVSAAGATQEFGFDTTGKAQDNMGWEDTTWEFVAVAEETTLELYSVDTNDPWRGPALDNVRVVAVPG